MFDVEDEYKVEEWKVNCEVDHRAKPEPKFNLTSRQARWLRTLRNTRYVKLPTDY